MSLRLPHVLILMTLILAAGVLSMQHLEADVGGSTVPSVAVLDVPALDAATATALLAQLPGAGLQGVAADEGPRQLFDGRLVARRAEPALADLLVDDW
jgi:hypothetical protein